MIKFPVRALLRNKTQAMLHGAIKLGADWMPEVYIVGQTQEEPYEMWCKAGKWRYSGEPHFLDVVGFQNPDGSFRPMTNELI